MYYRIVALHFLVADRSLIEVHNGCAEYRLCGPFQIITSHLEQINRQLHCSRDYIRDVIIFHFYCAMCLYCSIHLNRIYNLLKKGLYTITILLLACKT